VLVVLFLSAKKDKGCELKSTGVAAYPMFAATIAKQEKIVFFILKAFYLYIERDKYSARRYFNII